MTLVDSSHRTCTAHGRRAGHSGHGTACGKPDGHSAGHGGSHACGHPSRRAGNLHSRHSHPCRQSLVRRRRVQRRQRLLRFARRLRPHLHHARHLPVLRRPSPCATQSACQPRAARPYRRTAPDSLWTRGLLASARAVVERLALAETASTCSRAASAASDGSRLGGSPF